MSRIGVGMLPHDEYRGFFSAFKRIWAEEGPIAFYRGYLAYILAITFWMSVLPQATEFMMLSMPLIGGSSADSFGAKKPDAQYDPDMIAGGDRGKPLTVKGKQPDDEDDDEDEY